MTHTKGFLLAGPMLYGAIASVIAIGGLSIALKIQSSRLETCQVEFEVFKRETKRIAEAQEKENRRKEELDRKAKERTDEQHKTTIARLNSDIKRLRDANSRSSLTPQASPTTKRPDLACFDRTLFTQAIREVEGAIEAIVGEGAARTVELDLAKQWAKEVYQ